MIDPVILDRLQISGCLIDTNSLVYRLHPASPEHADTVRSIGTLYKEGVSLFLASQNLYEFWVVATRPIDLGGLGFDTGQARRAIDTLRGEFRILDEGPYFSEWFRLVNDYGIQGKAAHDARIVAVMIENRVDNILTFNAAHFRRFVEVTVVDPRSF